MSQNLLINLDNLLHCRSVERSRLEFKEGWDDNIKDAVVRTVSAFSNDLLNLNGGYIILGIKTDDKGNPVLPPEGLDNYDRDKIQREIVGECKGKISPDIFRFSLQRPIRIKPYLSYGHRAEITDHMKPPKKEDTVAVVIT